jgi:SSS family transporter
MHWLNWAIVVAYVGWVLVDGIRRSRGTEDLEGYYLANRSLPWWAVGLSVMATQLSAVTMIGTTGQGATDGIRFLQFYFGLPLAMVILGVTLVPFLHGSGVFTAYEYLERRFDARTRSLTSFLFLVSRGMSCGTIIAAPAVVLSAVFGWPLTWAVALIGIPTVIYTVLGGVQAVTWADVKQMVLIVIALLAIIVVLILQMPVAPDEALRIAGATGRLDAFDFSFTLTETYTFWSGILGGTFLMLSYFGTDQSQVQRYLTARSVDEARSSLLMSAYWKIPLQGLVLLVGVGVFVYYLFVPPPLLYNPAHEAEVREMAPEAWSELEQSWAVGFDARQQAAHTLADARTEARGSQLEAAAREAFLAREAEAEAIRSEALALAEDVTGESSRDVNYIIPRFVLGELPIGLTGLFIAGVIAAAMSSISSELNSLSTASVIDFYRRWYKPEATDAHYLAVSKLATLFWGVFACFVATYAATLGSLIEVVNRFGSFFYGSILGVFLLAMIPRGTAAGAFWGLLAGMGSVAAVTFGAPQISFLWHNVIGAVVVVAVGLGMGPGGRGLRRTAALLALLGLPMLGACAPAEPADEAPLRVATFNIWQLSAVKVDSVGPDGRGLDPQLSAAGEIIRRVSPDVLVLNEVDLALRDDGSLDENDLGRVVRQFIDRYVADGSGDFGYPHLFIAPSNTGDLSGLDLNRDGITGTPADVGTRAYGDDSWGYGEYPGQYSMAVVSRHPIDSAAARTFRLVRWANLPGNHLPYEFYGEVEDSLRLSSKSHWDVPVDAPNGRVNLWVSHPTPTGFDGDEDRNGLRNFDEIWFWLRYLDGEPVLRDDQGRPGGFAGSGPFIVAGDLNAAPDDEPTRADPNPAIAQLLGHPEIQDPPGLQGRPTFGGFGRWPGSRIDYVLPSTGLEVIDAGVASGPEFAPLDDIASDHYLVWVDLRFSPSR